MRQKVLYLRSKFYISDPFYFIQQEESKCQDQEEEAREGQEVAWGQGALEGHRQEGPAPVFSGREAAAPDQAAGLGRVPAAFMVALGTMALAVFTAALGIIMAPACRHRRTTMARAGASVLVRAQAGFGGRPGLRVPRAIIMAAVAEGAAASLPFLFCF